MSGLFPGVARPFPLTAAQRNLARVIDELTGVLARPPTYREMAADMDMDPRGIGRLLAGLEERDWLAPPG